MQPVLVDLKRLPEDATAAISKEVIEELGIYSKVKGITTDNASDEREGVALLLNFLNNVHGEGIPLQRFHVRGIAHIISTVVEECLHFVYKENFYNLIIY